MYNNSVIITYKVNGKDDNYNYERFKIGDGKQTVTALPFADNTKADKVHSHNLDEIKIKGIKHRQVSAERAVDLLIIENSEIIHNNISTVTYLGGDSHDYLEEHGYSGCLC